MVMKLKGRYSGVGVQKNRDGTAKKRYCIIFNNSIFVEKYKKIVTSYFYALQSYWRFVMIQISKFLF